MPRIPTSKPQDVRSRPSIGGQVNINSQDGFFKSIAAASAEAGAAIEKAQIEKQQLVDVKEANEVAVFQNERKAELQRRLTEETDVTKHEAIIDEWADNTVNLNLRPGVSNSAREKLQQNNNLFIQNARSSFIAQSTATAHTQAKAAAEVAAATAVEARDRPALITIFQDHPSFSKTEQSTQIQKWLYKIRAAEETDNNNFLKVEQESLDSLIASAETLEDIGELRAKVDSDPIYTQSDLGKRIKSLLEQSLTRKERTLVNRDESIFKDTVVNEMSAAQSIDELNEIFNKSKSDKHSETLKSDLIIARDNREKQMVTRNAQRINDEIKLLSTRMEGIGSGDIESLDAALAGVFDPEIKNFLSKSFSLGDGTRGITDPEFLELVDLVDSDRGLFDVISGKTIKRVEDFVLDPDTSMEARFAAAELLVARAALDDAWTLEAAMGYKETVGPDGEPVYEMTDWSNKVIYLDNFQRGMIQSVSTSLGNLIGKVAEEKDWTKSSLRPRQILQIYRTINSEFFLSQFKKSEELKTTSDLSKKIQEVFYDPDNGLINKHFKDSIPQQLSRLIYFKQEQAKKPL